MRLFLSFLLLLSAAAGQGPRLQISHTTESLRGVSAVSRDVAWASGTHGTYLRTVDGGVSWSAAQVPDAAALDFRGVVAFSADEAFLMSAGPGEQSRIYHTADGGKSWQLQFTNKNPKGFFDSIEFWDAKHGVVVGDPVADDAGKLKFEVLITDDGQNWRAVPASRLPAAVEGEGAFAASNSCIAILSNAWWSSGGAGETEIPRVARDDKKVGTGRDDRKIGDDNIWFATGGKVARVFHSGDGGETWAVYDTPVWHGPESAGIFSIAFRDAMDGVIVGGDYKHPNDDGANLAFTHDGGKTWELSEIHPQAFFSAVGYDHRVNVNARRERAEELKAEFKGKKERPRGEFAQRLFVVGQDFVFDFRPPANPRRVSAKKKLGMKFNAVSAFPEGGALVVGPAGAIAFLP